MRFAVLFLVGCAQAGEPRVEPGMPDAPPMMMPDARPDTMMPGSCASPFSGTLASWSFTGEPGNQAQTAFTSKATGVTAGAVTRSAGLTAVSGAGSINSSGWPMAAQLDPTKYYTLTIAPPAGCTLSITTAFVDARGSGTGPTMAAIATSADNYAQTSSVSTTAGTAATVAVANASSTVEVRIYGYAASAAGGTMRLQNQLSFMGSIQ